MDESGERTPGVSDATVYNHSQKLIDAGIRNAPALDADERRQGYP